MIDGTQLDSAESIVPEMTRPGKWIRVGDDG